MNQLVNNQTATVVYDRQYVKDNLHHIIDKVVDMVVDAAKPAFTTHGEKGMYLLANYSKPYIQAQLANVLQPSFKPVVELAIELLLAQAPAATKKSVGPAVVKCLDTSKGTCKESSKRCADECVDSTFTLIERAKATLSKCF